MLFKSNELYQEVPSVSKVAKSQKSLPIDLKHFLQLMAPVKNEVIQGYSNVKLREPRFSRKYNCPLCEKLLRKPIQTDRGELACEACYKERLKDDPNHCPIDGEPIGLTFPDKRIETDILDLDVYCNYDKCPWNGILRNLKAHLEECAFAPTYCELCNNPVVASQKDGHMEKCPGLLNNGCLHAGCDYKTTDFTEMKTHLTNNALHHAYLSKTTIMNLNEKVERQEIIIEELKKENEKRERNEIFQRCELEDLKEMVINLSERLNQKTDYEERIRKLEMENKTSVQARGAESKRVEPNSYNETKEIQKQVTMLSKTIADTDLRLQLFENTYHDGKLLWKIDNIESRLTQAKSGRVSALHSAPTFTTRFGYKFCARLYLNGDGIGRGTHLSLFFVLMRSEYDNLLTWPFNEQVKFTLHNQEDSTRHKEESFVPDKNSSSYQKPKKEMNVASGCPQFISMERFKHGGFIKDNCIFIEMNVVPLASRI